MLFLTACGGTGTEAGGGSPSGAPRPDASASASAGTPAGDPAGGSDGNTADDKTFCAFLTEEQPKLREVAPASGRRPR